MLRKFARLWLGAGLMLCLFAGVAVADPTPGPAEPASCRGSGPPPVACYAVPSNSGHYIGYYVGGACQCRGEGPTVTEGTWGWDYCGCLFPKRIILRWCHCRSCQGDTGSYRTTGPTNLRSKSTP
jgi:hypothetical protein